MVAIPSITSPTIAAIDAQYASSERRGHYPFIRGSAIGKCERHQWYLFRWVHDQEQFEGRLLRLFETGNIEEDRMVGWLKAIGMAVDAVDPDTGKQFEVVACDGHFMGHTDGQLTGLLEAPATIHLLECKTHNAKSFAQLKTHGLAASKPDHLAQMQIYMGLRGLSRGFYMAKNKDTDELHAERIHFDAAMFGALLAKAERIKAASSAPPKISEDPNWFGCRFCHSHSVCHGGAWALRNCRSCSFSDPINDGQWYCQRHERELSSFDQLAGCPNHIYLPSLVPLEQFDVDEEKCTISYLLPDGGTWIDGEGSSHG